MEGQGFSLLFAPGDRTPCGTRPAAFQRRAQQEPCAILLELDRVVITVDGTPYVNAEKEVEIAVARD